MTEPAPPSPRLWRAVFDTNVFVSAALSRNPTSPTRELLDRWERGEFELLTCAALVAEWAEKLIERNAPSAEVAKVLAALSALAEWIDVPDDVIPALLTDPDDNVVLACATLGRATHIVTYDPHFDSLGGEYQGIQIVKALPFLWAVRGDTPPDEATAAR